MTNPIIKIVNAGTGEEIERPMTAAEFKEHQAMQAAHAAVLSDREAKANAKAVLLERLGITEEEAALLLG